MRIRSHRTIAALAVAVTGVACGASSSNTGLAPLRVSCTDGQVWNGQACVPFGPGIKTAMSGVAQLDEGQLDRAIKSFESAVNQGPHAHPDHVRIFEQLGIAHSYKEDEAKAKQAFTKLLMLAPQHLLSYNLSPVATLKFEQARAALKDKPLPSVDVVLPVNNDVSRPVPIGVEVVADPTAMLHSATLYVRQSDGPLRAADFTLPEPGKRKDVVLPPLGGTQPQTLALHLVARDKSGSEVLLWASGAQPRELSVDYTPPTPLYKKGWFWATVGGVVAVGVGTTVYLLTREPGDFIDPGKFNPM